MQGWFVSYHNSWDVDRSGSQYSLNCSSGQGIIKKVKLKSGIVFAVSYGTLEASIASQILTTTGEPLFESRLL